MREKVGIWGLGESGTGAALLAKVKDYPFVAVSEAEPAEPHRSKLLSAGLDWVVTKEPWTYLSQCALVIRSPGIAPTHPGLQALLKAGVPVISDLEWAYRHLMPGQQFYLVTGTVGKSTTTTFLTHLLQTGGLYAVAAGNIGYSWALALLEHPEATHFVIEASSFQLWDAPTLKPNLAILTNLSPNHLDWHGSLDAYAKAKLQFVERLLPSDHLIYDGDSALLQAYLDRLTIRAQRWIYRETYQAPCHAWIENQKLICDMKRPQDEERFEISYEETPLETAPERKNSLAAVIGARLSEIRRPELRKGLQTLQRLPHRLQPVGTVRDVLYVNDSKSTTVESSWYALNSFQQPIIWIAGGRDKGNDYGPLVGLAAARVKALILIGEDVYKLEEAFRDQIPTIQRALSMDEAVVLADRLAQPGDVVLLSPACASFDWFKSYAERGDAFIKAVQALAQSYEKGTPPPLPPLP